MPAQPASLRSPTPLTSLAELWAMGESEKGEEGPLDFLGDSGGCSSLGREGVLRQLMHARDVAWRQ